MSTLGNPEQSASAGTEANKDRRVKTYSCNRCTSKKIKCDKSSPCSNCVKRGFECIFEARPPPQRRRRIPHSLSKDAVEKLQSGSPSESPARTRVIHKPPMPILSMRDSISLREPSGNSPGGRLVPEKGGHRYLESNLWSALGDHAESSEQTDTVLETEAIRTTTVGPVAQIDVANLIFGTYQSGHDLKTLRPSPIHMFRLWQIFLDNVNPLSKVIHVPTLQKKIFTECAAGKFSSGMETLMFSIYCAAITSMSSPACMEIFREPRPQLLMQYHAGAQKALANAQFLRSSDLLVLQGFAIYLLAAREICDPQTLWSLSGLATRFAQRIGVHRDGTSLGLSIFETQMRRRLWTHLAQFEYRAQELAGAGKSLVTPVADAQAPLNVNDSELDPDMKQMPLEHTGITEMAFMRMRWEIPHFFLRARAAAMGDSSYDGDWGVIAGTDVQLAEKDKLLCEFENQLREKFLKHCDNVVPLHLMTSTVAQMLICKVRLMARHPRFYFGKYMDISQAEKESVFDNAVRMLELANILQSSKNLEGFQWHARTYFQAEGVLHVLNELGHRFSGSKVDHAWKVTNELFKYHPQLLTDKKTLYLAIRRLTAETWTARCKALSASYQSVPAAPTFVAVILDQSNQGSSVVTSSSNYLQRSRGEDSGGNYHIFQQQTNSGSANDDMVPEPARMEEQFSFDPSSVDWMYWDGLIQEHQLDPKIDQYNFLDGNYPNYEF